MSLSHESEAAVSPKQHPQGVQPLGSRLMNGGCTGCGSVRHSGLGVLACLDDTVLLGILGLLHAFDLARIAVTSRALYCFAYHEPLWKALALEVLVWLYSRLSAVDVPSHSRSQGSQLCGCLQLRTDECFVAHHGADRTCVDEQELEDFTYNTSWRETYISGRVSRGFQQVTPLQVSNFYSDVLYLPWHFAHTPLAAAWMEADNIPRRDAAHLTLQQFQDEFEVPNRPIIITGEASSWAAMHKWTCAYFQNAFAGRRLNVGGMLLSYDNYLKYAADSRDELPLYLFDKHCLGWTQPGCSQSLAHDYEVPEYFTEDLFSVLGDNRPDYRWLIVGPKKSGSSFHKDPNSTSAWNAVITGSKKWVLWPPNSPPPGVHPSADGLDVSTPYTLHEWFDSFHAYAREEPAMLEGVCRAGDVLFVPRGWWHLAVNLEDTVAITQNYVTAANLPHVLQHLRNPTLVSGLHPEERATLHDRFVAALQQHKPQALAKITEMQAAKKRKAAEQSILSSLFAAAGPVKQDRRSGNKNNQRQRAAGPAVATDNSSNASSASGFSFGFAISGK